MKRRQSPRIIAVVKAILTGSIALSRSTAWAATPMPEPPPVDGWEHVARSYLQQQQADPLPSAILEAVRSHADKGDLAMGVALTYLLVDPAQVAALDTLWTDTLLQSGNPRLLQAYLQQRAQALPSAVTPAGEGEARVWLAGHGKHGHYDCCGCGCGGSSKASA